MTEKSNSLPVVLAIGGHDPGGGAGIQADIEAISANGCHAATVLTCVTVQDSCNLDSIFPAPPSQLLAQAEAVLADQQAAAIKIGLIGDLSIAQSLVHLLKEEPDIPVIFDPVLAAGGGADLADGELISYLCDELLPLCDLTTPNSLEARRLSETEGSIAHYAEALLESGAPAVLITGGHEAGNKVVNRLYTQHGVEKAYSWERLPGEYHGSGCTLAASIAANVAQGLPLLDAIEQGQEFAWLALSHGFSNGRCQSIPDRLFALRRNETDR